jgi:hypothetical protein
MEALLNPNISWSQLINGIDIPDKLYKYQYFSTSKGEENKYWKNNIQGEFHLSLGCEFEDMNDCKPYIQKTDVKEYLTDFLKAMNVEPVKIISAIKQFEDVFNEKIQNEIVNNYQKMIRIGCFTDSYQNEKMWKKYSNSNQGFCIEYNTKKESLFSHSMLPVIYTKEQYNMSYNYACSLILEFCRKGKNRSEEEQLQLYKSIYEKVIKTAYVPIFLKDDEKWSFEREYRLFFLKNRNTTNGMLRMDEVLDENYNIDLSKCITAIYLGKDFYSNENADELYKIILDIRNKKDVRFDIYKMNEYGIAEKQM